LRGRKKGRIRINLHQKKRSRARAPSTRWDKSPSQGKGTVVLPGRSTDLKSGKKRAFVERATTSTGCEGLDGKKGEAPLKKKPRQSAAKRILVRKERDLGCRRNQLERKGHYPWRKQSSGKEHRTAAFPRGRSPPLLENRECCCEEVLVRGKRPKSREKRKFSL